MGWCRGAPYSLASARAALADHPAADAVDTLVLELSGGQTGWLARRTSPGPRRIELRAPLPSGRHASHVSQLADTAERLGVDPLPAPILRLLAHHAPPASELVLELTGPDVTALGLGVLAPPRALVLELRDVLSAGHDDDLAEVEAALDVSGPARVDVALTGGRLSVDLDYAL